MLKAYPTDTGTVLITDPMVLPICRLKKMKSDDGLWEFWEDKAFVGKMYRYSPESRQTATIKHVPTKTKRQCEIVLVYDPSGPKFAMMPTECLDFDPIISHPKPQPQK